MTTPATATPLPSSDVSRIRVPIPRDRMSRAGRIRLGEQVATASDPNKLRPTATEHFVVVADDSGITSPEAAASFRDQYGDKPTRIPGVLLIGDAPEDILDAAWTAYRGAQGKGRLMRRCDGPDRLGGGGHCALRTPSGGWVAQACHCQAQGLSEDDRDHCDFRWSLRGLVLPEVLGVGTWDLVSGSVIGWNRVASRLQAAYDLAGTLRGLKAELVLIEATVQPPGYSQPHQVHVVDLVISGQTPLALMQGGGRVQIGRASNPDDAVEARADLAQLPSPLDEPDELLDAPSVEDTAPAAPDPPSPAAAGAPASPVASASPASSDVAGGDPTVPPVAMTGGDPAPTGPPAAQMVLLQRLQALDAAGRTRVRQLVEGITGEPSRLGPKKIAAFLLDHYQAMADEAGVPTLDIVLDVIADPPAAAPDNAVITDVRTPDEVAEQQAGAARFQEFADGDDPDPHVMTAAERAMPIEGDTPLPGMVDSPARSGYVAGQ